MATGLCGLLTCLTVDLGSARVAAQTQERAQPQCRPYSGASAEEILTRAAMFMGLDSLGPQVRRSTVAELTSDRFQADRMYAPVPYRSLTTQLAVSWHNGVAGRFQPRPAEAPAASALALRQIEADRPMDPWIVIGDWLRERAPMRVTQECFYRDYWRTVLVRNTADHPEERLYVDTRTGFPVKLERREPHLIFGDVLVEYVWTTWLKVGHATAPRSAFQLHDGETQRMWTHTAYALVPAESVGVAMPVTSLPIRSPDLSTPPDTVRVNASTFLLVTRTYTNVVTLQRDTVFIMDAQWNEDRARADSIWIGKLFPGRHPIVLVVTDLAWPHIAGVRYWVSNGATVITHRISRDFLNQVINRRWTLRPDLLEQRRSRIRPIMRTVDGGMPLAGGAIELRVIDGIASEGALMAYFPESQFLYAGDYIQPGSFGPLRPGFFRLTYLDEVKAAVQRNGFQPLSFAAMHVNLTPWSALMPETAR
jgi:hypothetical protein